jgi:hypothetical protein
MTPNESNIKITHGHYELIPERRRYDVLGVYPLAYTEIEFYPQDEEHISRYISGQVPFLTEHVEKPKQCKRCQRVVKRQYTYCYRCKCYLDKKKDGEVL